MELISGGGSGLMTVEMVVVMMMTMMTTVATVAMVVIGWKESGDR